ncbi:MAG: hypothetical protein WDM81_10280 [Rhizomicrobium sp.]
MIVQVQGVAVKTPQGRDQPDQCRAQDAPRSWWRSSSTAAATRPMSR